MFRQIGPWEILLILFIALLIFGAKRLPEIGKSLGRSLKEFKSATKGLADDVKSGMEEDGQAAKADAPAPSEDKDPSARPARDD